MNTLNIAATPKTIIAKPAILLIHHNCFSLNFLRKIFIKKVNINHQIIAPPKTPATISHDFIALSSAETIPIPANAATNKNTAKGLERVKIKLKSNLQSIYSFSTMPSNLLNWIRSKNIYAK